MYTDQRGATITTESDSRVTGFGRILRKFKLDELPQLWNILIGDMSFVGPRPDVPGYLDHAGPEWDEVKALKPGITGPATIYFRHEERLLASCGDPVLYNDTVVWPKKLELNLAYAREWTFAKDVRYILSTIFLRS